MTEVGNTIDVTESTTLCIVLYAAKNTYWNLSGGKYK